MKPLLFPVTLLAALLLVSMSAQPQTSNRRRGPYPPQSPNVFDQMDERRRQDEQKEQAEKRAREASALERRKAELSQLNDELPRLIQLAQELQQKLNSADLKTTLPAELRGQGEQLERAARQVHKRIRSL